MSEGTIGRQRHAVLAVGVTRKLIFISDTGVHIGVGIPVADSYSLVDSTVKDTPSYSIGMPSTVAAARSHTKTHFFS